MCDSAASVLLPVHVKACTAAVLWLQIGSESSLVTVADAAACVMASGRESDDVAGADWGSPAGPARAASVSPGVDLFCALPDCMTCSVRPTLLSESSSRASDCCRAGGRLLSPSRAVSRAVCTALTAAEAAAACSVCCCLVSDAVIAACCEARQARFSSNHVFKKAVSSLEPGSACNNNNDWCLFQVPADAGGSQACWSLSLRTLSLLHSSNKVTLTFFPAAD